MHGYRHLEEVEGGATQGRVVAPPAAPPRMPQQAAEVAADCGWGMAGAMAEEARGQCHQARNQQPAFRVNQTSTNPCSLPEEFPLMPLKSEAPSASCSSAATCAS